MNMSMIDTDGECIPGTEDGYKYFGAAKNLPKVRELFKREAPPAPPKNREELYKRVTFEYLGMGDTSELEKIEKEAETRLKEAAH